MPLRKASNGLRKAEAAREVPPRATSFNFDDVDNDSDGVGQSGSVTESDYSDVQEWFAEYTRALKKKGLSPTEAARRLIQESSENTRASTF